MVKATARPAVPKPTTAAEVLELCQGTVEVCERQRVEVVDLRFVDLLGGWQHFSIPAEELSQELFTEGIGFDGSSIRGFQHIHESDMLLLPDPATAHAALRAGEVDYWENPPLDFVPSMERDPNLTVFVTDPRGTQGLLRPNHVQPPFNHKKARQALLWAVDQEAYLRAAIGQPKYYRTCPGYFMCGNLPYESTVGAPARPDPERARQLLKESGYDGSPVVLMDPTDIALLHGATLVARELLARVGFNVDLQAMDWSTLVARRAKKEPVKEGGWNLFHTWAISADTMTPAVNSAIAGTCERAWFGWYCSEAMERLRSEFARTTDQARRKQLAEEIQRLAFDEVPYVPWGQWVLPSAHRKNVRGVLQFGAQLLWNIAV
ncbi:MAG: glutamine synthetase beta-grasp domain-containing protein [Candidatus Rokubacteria bacterium]|nr:glutamine synthetase beta-grasp domain-containing protein [Candidatus Rokubacteria bacterium]